MLATIRNREPRRVDVVAPPSTPRESFDIARRRHYVMLLRRWAQERLPAGTKAALDAAEWIRDLLLHGSAAESSANEGSLLVRLRMRLLADRPAQWRARVADRASPSSRVEQLVGRDNLHAWEDALARLSLRQRELVILRVEFGLDFGAIAHEVGGSVESIRAETVNALASLIDVLGSLARGRAA